MNLAIRALRGTRERENPPKTLDGFTLAAYALSCVDSWESVATCRAYRKSRLQFGNTASRPTRTAGREADDVRSKTGESGLQRRGIGAIGGTPEGGKELRPKQVLKKSAPPRAKRLQQRSSARSEAFEPSPSSLLLMNAQSKNACELST